MAGQNPYGSLLAAAASAAPKPAMPGAPGAAGPPPAMPPMPNLPPPPTNTGAMDVGKKAPKEAASDAILALRDLKGHFPNLGMQVDGWMEAIKSATQPGGVAGAKGANDGAGPSAIEPPTTPEAATAALDD